MAPLPENNTPRFWLDYNDGENDHSLMVRYVASGATLADVMDNLDAVLVEMEPMLYAITITGARASASGSNFSLPVTWTGAAEYGADPMPTLLAPRETRWVGRSQLGRKVSWSFYGCKYTSPDSYRLTVGDLAAVGDVIAAIEAAITADVFVAIDLTAPAVYPYANVNFNSYWERQARG